MTSLLNFTSTSSSNSPNQIPSLGTSSLFSNLKLPTTIIIQPPSSTQTTTNTLLTKRCKPAELGDLLMKKIKTTTLSSGVNSSHQSPISKENFDENHSEDHNALESNSIIEEIGSPSIKSSCDHDDKHNSQKLMENVLLPQRSISTPILFNTFNHKPHHDGHKQVQQALETLQKKLLIHEQAVSLREILLKFQAVQEPLNIPPLLSSSNSTHSLNINGKSQEGKIPAKIDCQGFEVIYGPVEYPLLSMSGHGFGEDNCQKTSSKNPKSSMKFEHALLDSLCVTRAETQRSESEEASSNTSEEVSQPAEGRRARTRKPTAKKLESENMRKSQKKEKEQDREKNKVKQQRKNDCMVNAKKIAH